MPPGVGPYLLSLSALKSDLPLFSTVPWGLALGSVCNIKCNFMQLLMMIYFMSSQLHRVIVLSLALEAISTLILQGQISRIPFRAALKSFCFALNINLDWASKVPSKWLILVPAQVTSKIKASLIFRLKIYTLHVQNNFAFCDCFPWN